MRIVVPVVLALIVTMGLSYACYELWMLLDKQIKGTVLANFKFVPAVIASFLLLSFADYLFAWIERKFVATRNEN